MKLVILIAFIAISGVRVGAQEQSNEVAESNFEANENQLLENEANTQSIQQRNELSNYYNRIPKKRFYGYKRGDPKLKFRRYYKKAGASMEKTKPFGQQLSNIRDMPAQFEDSQLEKNVQRYNRSVEASDQSRNKLGDHNNDKADGFAFKNIMPNWKFFDKSKNAKGKSDNENKANNKAESTAAIKKEEMPIVRYMNESYVLLPDQNKLVLLKALNLSKVFRGDQFDNVGREQTGYRIIKVDEGASENTKTDAHTAECDAHGKNGEEKSKMTPSKDADIEVDLKEEVLSCTADKLEKYLQSLKNKCKEGNEQETRIESKERKLNTVKDSLTNLPKLVSVDNDNNAPSRRLSKADLMHLNITINGLVMKDEKPSQIRGNGTINFQPGLKEERNRRAIRFPFINRMITRKNLENEAVEANREAAQAEVQEELQAEAQAEGDQQSEGGGEIQVEPKKEKLKKKKKSKNNKSKTTTPAPSKSEISNSSMPSYQISNEIIKMVGQMVNSNPHMKTLWPSLKRNKPKSMQNPAMNLRNLCKGSGRKRLEEMIRRAMASVDQIIEQEVQARSCAPLSEDLQDFYEQILSLHAKQAKRTEEREEKLNKSENLEQETTTCELKETNESQQSKNEEKKPEECELNNNLLYDMIHERKLQYNREVSEARRRREAIRRTRDLKMDTANSTLVRKLREGYSQAFLKLHEVADAIDRAVVLGEAT